MFILATATTGEPTSNIPVVLQRCEIYSVFCIRIFQPFGNTLCSTFCSCASRMSCGQWLLQVKCLQRHAVSARRRHKGRISYLCVFNMGKNQSGSENNTRQTENNHRKNISNKQIISQPRKYFILFATR